MRLKILRYTYQAACARYAHALQAVDLQAMTITSTSATSLVPAATAVDVPSQGSPEPPSTQQ